MNRNRFNILVAATVGFISGMVFVLPALNAKNKEAFQAMTMLDAVGYKLWNATEKGNETMRIWVKTQY